MNGISGLPDNVIPSVNQFLEENPIQAPTENQGQERPTTVVGQTIPRAPGEARQNTQQELPEAPPLAQRTATPGLSRAQKVLEPLLSGLRNIGQTIAKAFERPQQLPQTLRMAMPPGGIAFNLDTKCLPPTLPKGISVGEFQTKLQGKIFEGYQLVQDLTNGRIPNRQCTVEDMTNIMWFLQVQGESKIGQSFAQGAFSIPDPNGNIHKFLDSSPEAYQRESSHLDEIQRQPGCKHRSIDARGSNANLDHLLPHGMQTLLYGKLPKETANMPEQRLYLKVEEHGCWMSKPKGGRDVDGPGRPYNKHDLGSFLGHIGTTIPSLLRKLSGKGEGEGTFKERLPPALTNGYKALVNGMHHEVKTFLEYGNPTSKSGGVRVMLDNINNVLESRYILKISPEQCEKLEQFKAQHLSGRHGLDHPECRFGEEIILTSGELSEGVRPESANKQLSNLLAKFDKNLVTSNQFLAGSNHSPENIIQTSPQEMCDDLEDRKFLQEHINDANFSRDKFTGIEPHPTDKAKFIAKFGTNQMVFSDRTSSNLELRGQVLREKLATRNYQNLGDLIGQNYLTAMDSVFHMCCKPAIFDLMSDMSGHSEAFRDRIIESVEHIRIGNTTIGEAFGPMLRNHPK
jgi:hypothetical protein